MTFSFSISFIRLYFISWLLKWPQKENTEMKELFQLQQGTFITCFVGQSVCLSQKFKFSIFQHFIGNNSCFHVGKLIVGKLSHNPKPNLGKLALNSHNPATHPPTKDPNEGARIQFRPENNGCLTQWVNLQDILNATLIIISLKLTLSNPGKKF